MLHPHAAYTRRLCAKMHGPHIEADHCTCQRHRACRNPNLLNKRGFGYEIRLSAGTMAPGNPRLGQCALGLAAAIYQNQTTLLTKLESLKDCRGCLEIIRNDALVGSLPIRAPILTWRFEFRVSAFPTMVANSRIKSEP